MHNVKFLEKEWSKLNFKRFIVKFGLIIFTILIASVILTLVFSNIDFNSFYEEKKIEEKIIIDEPKIEEDIEEEIVQPPIYKNIIEEEEKVIESKNPIISISKTKKDFLTTLKDKYNKSPDYMSAIAIAEEFYKKDSYKESLIWSIRANEIDDTKDESWLIFANSKIKLNKKIEAINALKIYLSKNSSNRIEELLNKLQKDIKLKQKIEPKEREFNKKESKKELLSKIKILKKAYYAYPSARDALNLTKNYIKIENYKNCTFWAEKLIKILPHDESGYLYYGTCGLKVRYLTKSINKLKQYLKDHKSEKINSLIKKLEKAKRK